MRFGRLSEVKNGLAPIVAQHRVVTKPTQLTPAGLARRRISFIGLECPEVNNGPH